MNAPDPAEEYDVIAAGYHWIYSDRTLTGQPFVDAHQDVLSSLPPSASILDCACGIGIHAIALRRLGFDVSGSDASAGMVAQAQVHAAEAGLEIPFEVRRWADLSGPQFDAVFCCGNAIGHCRDEEEMVASLQGMFRVLKPGGSLVLDTRNWEKLMASRPQVTPLGPRMREGVRALPVYFWRFPDTWGAPVTITCALVQENASGVSVWSHHVTYFPFTHEDLLRRVRSAGFELVSSDFGEHRETYRILARRPE